ncbi:hypothetical protein [Streptomyces dioscori]|uniref:hypothetical protein n=1 Tax=Streptomyces dioscori TaxID=2109333 RepID=UPI00131B41BF|nr:hypothetical protein [Streptomyces dioscori]
MPPGQHALRGSQGDRIGRPNTLLTVIPLMSGSAAAIELLPTCSAVGLASLPS